MTITITNMTDTRTKPKITTLYVTDIRMKVNSNHPVSYRQEDESEQ